MIRVMFRAVGVLTLFAPELTAIVVRADMPDQNNHPGQVKVNGSMFNGTDQFRLAGFDSASANPMSRLSEIPLQFEENVGQTDCAVEFLARRGPLTMFLSPSQSVVRITPPPHRDSYLPPVAITMTLVGGAPDALGVRMDELPGKANYFRGGDPAAWHRNVSTYRCVRYAGVYPGIDLVHYGNPLRLEFDFIVEPGSDPSLIEMHFAGMEEIRIDDFGNLVLTVSGGELRHDAPVLYQEREGGRETVTGRFKFRGPSSIGFEVDAYDSTRTLVIDPTLEYATYLGGSSGSDTGASIKVNSAGEAFIAGWTLSTDFPVTAGAWDEVHGDGITASQDIYVCKLNATGTGLIYSTYLGGLSGDGTNGSNRALGIEIDAAGYAFVGGQTETLSVPLPNMFPTTPGAFDETRNGASDGFIAKLTPAGDDLVFSTFLGGSMGDFVRSIDIDPDGNVYDCGQVLATALVNVPPTTQVTQLGTPGGSTFYVAKLSADGSSLPWITYVGGNSTSLISVYDIIVNAAGEAHLTGTVTGTGWPTVNAVQPVINGRDTWIGKLTAAGDALQWATFYGGSGGDGDTEAALDLDADGNLFLATNTVSTDYPVTAGAYDTTYNGTTTNDVALVKFSPTGAVLFATYLGGSTDDLVRDLALDANGNPIVTGQTQSTNFPTAGLAFQTTIGGGVLDTFVSKLSSGGTRLLHSTYVGGSGSGLSDRGYTVDVDALGYAYVAGESSSANFPVTSGAFQTVRNGTEDGIVYKLLVNFEPTIVGCVATASAECTSPSGADLQLTITVGDGDGDGLSVEWFVDGDSVQIDPVTAGGELATSANLTLDHTYTVGVHTVEAHVSDGQAAPVVCTTEVTITESLPMIVTPPMDTTLCIGEPGALTVVASGTAPLSYQWRKGGVDINGEIADTLPLNPSSLFDAGSFDVVVINACGSSITSPPAILTISNDAPVISLNGSASMMLECHIDAYAEPGATAMDDCDVSVNVMISGDMVDVDTVGTYQVAYDATDSQSNPAVQVIRTVEVVDATIPVIVLNGPAKMMLECGVDVYVELGAIVDDACDQTLAVATIGGDTVADAVPGTYVVSYNASDASANDALEVNRSVMVQDTTSPAFTGCPMDISMDAAPDSCLEVVFWTPPTATDECDANLPPLVVSHQPGDSFPVGPTTVTYTATDNFLLTSVCSFTITIVSEDDCGPCLTDADCVAANDNVCLCDRCVNQFCVNSPIEYGNVNCAGPVNQASLDDILCCLAGFASFAACPNADIHPTCTGNDIISLDDILSVLGAFAGTDPCGCVPS